MLVIGSAAAGTAKQDRQIKASEAFLIRTLLQPAGRAGRDESDAWRGGLLTRIRSDPDRAPIYTRSPSDES
jgi:hypothetical protein